MNDIVDYLDKKQVPYGPFLEEWKPVEGQDNPYLISSYGRIKSYNRMNKTWNLLKPNSNTEYPSVTLKRNKKWRFTNVHSLVAKAFLFKSEANMQVNHIDGCKSNNHKLNLEWVTVRDNIRHSYKIGLIKRGRGVNSSNFGKRAGLCNSAKKVRTKDGNVYNSLLEASKCSGINYKKLSSMLNNKIENTSGMSYIAKEALKVGGSNE